MFELKSPSESIYLYIKYLDIDLLSPRWQSRHLCLHFFGNLGPHLAVLLQSFLISFHRRWYIYNKLTMAQQELIWLIKCRWQIKLATARVCSSWRTVCTASLKLLHVFAPYLTLFIWNLRPYTISNGYKHISIDTHGCNIGALLFRLLLLTV